ncbi:MAG: mucoidy inhibitor MuiA family protein [Acidobacteriota bacterium]
MVFRAGSSWCRSAVSSLVLAGAVSWSGAAESLSVDAPITAVTVFPDRAQVTRRVDVDLPAGLTVVTFPDLPSGLDVDSMQISAAGVPVILGAVELKQEATEPAESAGLIEAREEVRRLQAAITRLDGENAIASELRAFLGALRASTTKQASETLGEGRPDAESIGHVYDLVRSRLRELADESVSRDARRESLEKDLEVARARLATARPAGAIRTQFATVEIDPAHAGRLEIVLTYVTPGASWRPAYRVTLDDATGAIRLGSQAVVRQNTGEDWENVSLHVSTSSPVRGIQPPELRPLYLTPAKNRQASGGFIEGLPLLGRNQQDVMARAEGVVDGVSDHDPLAGAFLGNLDAEEFRSVETVTSGADVRSRRPSASKQATVRRASYNVTFEVTGSSTVLADGRDHRVSLQSAALSGDIEYRTVPSVNPVAFPVAKTKAPEAYPLLAGPASVFVGGAHLGAFHLRETAPGADLSIPFGIDGRIAVERTPLPRVEGDTGRSGRERHISSAFRTSVENLRNEAVSLVVEDRVPVAENERIRVEMGKATTPGWEPVKNRPGVLQWTVELASQEKREFILEYTVRFPRDLPIARRHGLR